MACAATLAFKKLLRRVVKGFDKADLLGTMKLLIASFIVLPLLPDRTLCPFDALNPYRLWLLVILITVLGLVGYMAVRRVRTRTGTLIAAVAGAPSFLYRVQSCRLPVMPRRSSRRPAAS